MRWSGTAKALHWATAALVIGLLVLGWKMMSPSIPMAERFDLFQLHKSFGFVALGVVLLRVAHLGVRRAPALPSGRLERSLVRIGRALLWALLFATPLSGWATASASPLEIPTLFFGLFRMPDLVSPDASTFAVAAALHLSLAIVFAALIGGHVAAALKHHFGNRDDTLIGMLPTALHRDIKKCQF
ncbi:cytochrome b [Methylopila sp. M107]|uniref:cytochrome b n=1 Tax=Methylopila sp. M107 TaxID=1101190 RepID=UPI0003629D1F|nr:cytochrome b [Methylopila sp. M107]